MNKTIENSGHSVNKSQRVAYIFLLPSLLIFLTFIILPLVASLMMGTLKMDIFLQKITFVGIENFIKLITDDRFWNALVNTFYFTVVEMPLQVIFALVVAIYVQKNTRFRKLLRSAYYIPVTCSLTAMGIVWSILLDPSLGMYPYFLKIAGLPGIEFLKDPNMAMPSIILMTIWKNFGLTMVILIAGIQGIPDTYYEAARIDGANKWIQFRHITIPLLIPALGFCVITNTIGSLQVFDQVYVMTQGGPMFRTETLVQYIYNRGFCIAPFDLGYASAIAEVLFVIIAIITLMMYNFFIKKETVDM
jgi:multiple sugar transport system permease protein